MTLNSPGVEVQVVDESFYVPAAPSTRPLIIVATASNKPNASGTGIAPGTLDANNGKLYLISSQRELSATFGTPYFYTDPNGNPIHGGELNEYGLQAAYSFLGIANSAFVIRADIDLSQLVSQYTEPGSYPAPGTYWLDTQNTRVGIFQWDGNPATVKGGQKFTNKVPHIITEASELEETPDPDLGYSLPRSSLGISGDYALTSVTNINRLFFKNRSSQWVEVGSNDWSKSWPTIKGTKVNPTIVIPQNGPNPSMLINGVEVIAQTSSILDLAAEINSAQIRGISAAVVDFQLEIYSDGAVDSPQLDSSRSNAIVIAAGVGSLVAGSTTTSMIGIAVGTYYGPYLQISPHTTVPRFKSTDPAPRPTGSVWIKTTDVNLGARWRVKLWNTNTNDWDPVRAPMYSSLEDATYELDRAGGGKNIPMGSLFVQYNFDETYETSDKTNVATFKIWRRVRPDPTQVVSLEVISTTFEANMTYTFQIAETQSGKPGIQAFKTISFTAAGAPQDAKAIANAIAAAGAETQSPFKFIEATVENNKLIIYHRAGGDFKLRDGNNQPLEKIGFVSWNNSTLSGTANLYQDPLDPFVGTQIPNIIPAEYYGTRWWVASNWRPLIYTASPDAPQSLPANGRLWYNSTLDEVDVMIHNGYRWVGYLDPTSPYFDSRSDYQTDPNGPIITATKPITQSDGSTLRHGDLWIDTGDLENYPSMYRWDGYNLVWVPVDNTDQTTELGIIFADARYNTSGANSDVPGKIADLLLSNFIDFDAPDPNLYPRGMMLFNTRRSGFNVKKFVRNYIDVDADNVRMYDESMDTYYPHRWVNASGNAEDGAGLFGRKAQRAVVVKHLKQVIDTNLLIRDWERNTFNLMACPGYCETISNMVNLNYDRRLTGFVIGDSPFRLAADTTALNDWGSNANLALDNGDKGLVTYDAYLGVYYPSGYSTDNLGNRIVVPSSHMILRTIALSDAVSWPWFAPAGLRRGGVTNATSIGYIDAKSGEFQSIALNEGQRDALYMVKVNPITFITGSGLVVFGQKTRYSASSSLDRINVARLVIYLRGRLDALCKPYIFEPNDKITRDEVKAATDSLMLDLVGKRAIYDFLVVCDESNNTPTRIDRNELWLDIAIEPVKAIEFIYIPLRLKNTGSIAGLTTGK